MDFTYWNNYYNKNLAPKEPSPFAKEVLSKLEKDKKLIELGCGNGRDSIYFADNGINVTVIDQCETSIENLRKSTNKETLKFYSDNFIDSNLLKKNKYDYVYSRFTMHSISEIQQEESLINAYKSLNDNGVLFIEVRSIKDNIFGMGVEVERNAYIYNDHYRRFIVKEEILDKLIEIGFKIKFADENNGYAKYKNDDPVVIRVIAEKCER